VSQDTLRFGCFLAGLIGFVAWELVARHHHPTVPVSRRWLVNLSLGAINGLVTSVVCASCLLLASIEAAPWRYGVFNVLPAPGWLRVVLEVLLLDLVVYLLHRAFHRWPLLWRLHRVHHTDRDLDVTSASRFHAGEVVVSGVTKFTTVQLLGISPVGLITFEVFMLLSSQFQHANIRLPARVERTLWKVLVPPAMHRIHHHPLRITTDSNYGTLTSAWDRLFGTLRAAAPSDREFGLPESPRAPPLGLVELLLLPVRHPIPRSQESA
jgi:sterol desaturase/sphingolipid hydroxylase (fatty acid hydroxylase superfamily)